MRAAVADDGRDARAGRVAWAVAAAGLALQLAVNYAGGYGIFRDEMYYLACASHLDWGYVDQPSLSILLLAGVRALVGDSVFAIRLLPALAGFALVLLTGRLARELGGGLRATLLATIGALVSPVYLSLFGFFSMNAFDLVFMALTFLILVRIAKGGNRRLWLLFGAATGLAFENKISILFLGAGLFVGLVLSPLRRELLTRWFWMGMAIAAVLALPYAVWQVAHDFVTLSFMKNAALNKNAPTTPVAFLRGQVDNMHPFNVVLWAPGLLYLLLAPAARRFRFLGVAYVVVFLMFATQNGKPYYLAGYYPVLLAAGGVAIERLTSRRLLAWVTPALVVVLLAGGAAVVPLVLPVLPPEDFVAYAAKIGASPGGEERDQPAKLGQHYADMFGWRELAETVAQVYRTLTPEEQAKVTIFCVNYGQAGAIDYFGPALGLPKAISGHNSYWVWGPGNAKADVVIVVGADGSDLGQLYDHYELAAVADHPYARSFERNRRIFLCRGGRFSIKELWPRLKLLI